MGCVDLPLQFHFLAIYQHWKENGNLKKVEWPPSAFLFISAFAVLDGKRIDAT